jgi:RHH-type proline utilization regulon transcriptional repressor/proline dehydrogenase/delta 1-pyrroline-5-carboxylate dehydrogenase
LTLANLAPLAPGIESFLVLFFKKEHTSFSMAPIPPFRPHYAPDDALLAARFLAGATLTPLREARLDAEARRLINAIRDSTSGIGGIEALLREYSLSTPEGLALMVLAEGLLRVPDDATADKLIEDKLGQGGFAEGGSHQAESLLVSASAWALGLSARLIGPTDTPEGILRGVVRRLGLPTVRGAMRQAMRVMGSHFVLGQTIDEALARATSRAGRVFRYSFDMLGEGARTADDAARYQASYAAAIDAIGKAAGNKPLPDRPGISVKLSALHPRYEAVSSGRVLHELVPRVRDLARAACIRGLNFTIDAEEADRLELSLDVIATVAEDRQLAGWDGFGLAIQAYGKRAEQVIDWIGDLATSLDRRFMVRLVKGAYWDTEVKRAQERGLHDYPVFTRKAMTDLSYVACAERLLALRARIYPQFATHNALTVASVIERAGSTEGYEFQRLHGMGDALYAALLEAHPGIGVRTYAPVGVHRDLLAYLVRRLLENGANSSFVSVAADADVPVETLLRRPSAIIGTPDRARNASLPLPAALYGASRTNSAGIEFGHAATLLALIETVHAQDTQAEAAPIINGAVQAGAAQTAVSPIDGARSVGRVVLATPQMADAAMAAAKAGFRAWSLTSSEQRADTLERAADLLEARTGRFLALLASEAGKTLDDGVAELREAVDFLRYYAAQARTLFNDGEILPGPTGERNVLRYRGRGVFVCISPWNFPLAIFTGQIAAALAAGNTVVAKPAEQTPLIAAETIHLLHEAGVPKTALHFLTGAGEIGARLVAHPAVAGVVFTGSTPVAWAINRALAAKDGPIVQLIAETGGINAMIVDATALPEQVVDDAVLSAFRSAGQRCSALRLLAVQDDVADRVIEMLVGAARELKIGDPRDPATHIGPVIDAEARDRLLAHIDRMQGFARTHYAGEAPARGTYVAPHIFELSKTSDLTQEVFGPVLHVVRYRASELDSLLDAIEASGYGLTLGIHTRIDATAERIAERLSVGNVYVNRNMIGAVVGVQPFGGSGLSGTGPKAGGPDYLRRFAIEQTVSTNTAAAGGNAALLSAEE